MPKKRKLVTIRKDGTVVIAIGSSNENADWLKLIDKGKHKKKDIRATEEALRQHKKDSNV